MFSQRVSGSAALLSLATLTLAFGGCSRQGDGLNVSIRDTEASYHALDQKSDVRLLAPDGKKFLLAETGDPSKVVIDAIVDNSYQPQGQAAVQELLFAYQAGEQSTRQSDIQVKINFASSFVTNRVGDCINITIIPNTRR